MKIGSLFSGAGGLDLAVEATFNGRTVWHCEIDPAASKVLAARWSDVPNLGDITAIDWATVEPIEVLCGGFPCQDVSAAGRRAGLADGTRSGLWAMFADAIAALRPRIVVIENVRGLLSAKAHRAMESAETAVGNGHPEPVLRAVGAVLGDLADLGYDAQWATVSAASVGAPHRRERVFILATADAASERRHQRQPEPARIERRPDAAERSDEPIDLLPTPVATDAAGSARHTTRTGVAHSGTSLTAALRLLPTPCAQQSGNTPENHLTKKPGRQRVTDLAILVENDLLETGGQLLPTPSVADGTGGHVNRSGTRSNELLLPGIVRELLPTPSAADGERGPDYQRRNRDASGGDDLITTAVEAVKTATWGRYEPAIRRWETITRPAPAPTEPNSRGNPRLAPAFSEWMLGWPAGWATAVAGIKRNDQLRIIGNGVCPQQAAVTIVQLLDVAATA